MPRDSGSVRRAVATATTVGLAALGLAACAAGSAALALTTDDASTVVASGDPTTTMDMPMSMGISPSVPAAPSLAPNAVSTNNVDFTPSRDRGQGLPRAIGVVTERALTLTESTAAFGARRVARAERLHTGQLITLRGNGISDRAVVVKGFAC